MPIVLVHVQGAVVIEHLMQVLCGFLRQILHAIAQKDHLLMCKLLQRQVVLGGHQFLKDLSLDFEGTTTMCRQLLVFNLFHDDALFFLEQSLMVCDLKVWIVKTKVPGVRLDHSRVP